MLRMLSLLCICPKGVILMVEDEEVLIDKMTKGKMNKVLVKLGME